MILIDPPGFGGTNCILWFPVRVELFSVNEDIEVRKRCQVWQLNLQHVQDWLAGRTSIPPEFVAETEEILERRIFGEEDARNSPRIFKISQGHKKHPEEPYRLRSLRLNNTNEFNEL